MDCKDIIQKGEDAKFSVVIKEDGFDMDTGNFHIDLLYGMMGEKLTIKKEDMVAGSDEKFYFNFNTKDMTGRVTAVCTYDVEDTDQPDDVLTKRDSQLLCFVVADPLPRFLCAPGKDLCEHMVEYERTGESDVASNYCYLLTSRNDRVITDNDEYVLVLKVPE